MKPNIPFFARWCAWWHESTTGHRVKKHYVKGKYRRLWCDQCWKTFHVTP